MRKVYAIVENGTVINIAVSEKPLGKNWIESKKAKKGDSYEPITNRFTTPPPIPEPPQRKSRLDRLIDRLLEKGVIDGGDV